MSTDDSIMNSMNGTGGEEEHRNEPAPASAPRRRIEFLTGARDTIPLIIGAIPFGIIFGTISMTAGLSLFQTLGMSLFVFAGSAQFVAIGLIAAGTGWPIILLTTFVVNLRHSLYSATLAPHVSSLPQRWQIPIAFFLTDETFAVVARRFQHEPATSDKNADPPGGSAGTEVHDQKGGRADADPGARWYYLGSALAMYANWQLCTLLGATIGRMIPNAAEWGLDFAMPVTFIGMTVPYLKTKPMIYTVIAAGAISVLAFGLPSKLGLIAAIAAGILCGTLSERRLER